MRSGKIILLLVVCLLVACEKQSPEGLIHVNGRAISADEFVFSYETSPRSVISGPKEKAYNQVLDRLVERVLLAQESQRRGLDQEPENARALRYLEDAAIRRELFREKIRNVTMITQGDMRHAFAMDQKTLWIQHVILDSITDEKPVAWNPNWTHTPINPTLKNVELEGVGMVDQVGWNDVDLELEKALYDLELNDWTAPIEKYGQSHLFRLLNIETNQMSSENQFIQEQEHYQSTLRKREEHARSFAFVQETMQPENLIIKGQVLEQLTQVLWSFKSNPDVVIGEDESEFELEAIRLDDIGASKLAQFKSGELTVDDFRFYYQMNPQKLEANSPAALRQKLVNAVGIYVRDVVFAEMGRNEGLHQRKEVTEDYRYWQERLLAAKLEQHIQVLSKDENGTDSTQTDDIASRMLTELSTTLRNQAVISVDMDMLMSLETSDAGLPRKIDFFTTYLN